ncbi:MAG: sodium ion-translocating decarboxylase subunit beta [Chloroflexi bacterium]|nr:sodium ion-translocating decarboxylase subunit beta [Chloroflexota bacterium]HOC20370.1 sodium ion-translocating decarboxylase subunit beta [Anaerolineae bacterium]HOS79989.1 sodium ion-translocating decarboxylase subunit beta [Anaerolineae bacterium]HQE98928.1 sodium ion-translocating decarboxylase subunit beta [Anaerolineae bacterium]HQJ11612.1 sodium ion-translocating decarboxylase subunit beta [Anaerolineae bacterium]
MILVGGVLLYFAIVKEYEPSLLLPIGVGIIIANLPLSAMIDPEENGMLYLLYNAGVRTELFPLLIFVGVGAMMDFRPLLAQPVFALMGAAGQFGIFGTLILAIALGFKLPEAASIGIIGAIDGPTSIYVANKLLVEYPAARGLPPNPGMAGIIAVVAYSYMSLVPIIQPPIMRALTTREERRTHMEYAPRPVSKLALILFPLIVTVAVGILVPQAAPLIASLMLGNLMKEAGVVDRLSKASQNEIINIATLFLGLAVGSTMTAKSFLNADTLKILGLGLVAFGLDTAAGVLFGKFLYRVSGKKINPLVGAAGISAFPMAGRLVQKLANDEDYSNFVLMHAMGANTAGQLGSVIAGGVLLTLVLPMVGL